MKLRLHRNTIRFRLSQSDLATLGQEGVLSEQISFGPLPEHQVVYGLERGQEKEIRSSFQDHYIKIIIPGDEIQEWVNQPEQVGIYADLHSAENQTIKIILEKDFKCLADRPGEEEGDLYPNPARKS